MLESGSLMGADFVGMLLGELGADVIKLEAPQSGDYLRDILGQIVPHHSPAHLQFNGGKRSIALDLKNAAALPIFWRLLSTTDVFVDGNVAGVCDRLGIGYAAQRRLKPDIVYCQNTGFGAEGPYADIPMHGEMMTAAAAARPVAMGSDGLVERAQPPPGLFSAETGGHGPAAAGFTSALYITSALAYRASSGRGSRIDVSGVQSVIAHAAVATTYALNDHRIRDRNSMPERDRGRLFGAKYQFYQTKDAKYVMLGCIEPKFWKRFCEGVDRPDLAERNDNPEVPVDWGGGQDDLRPEVQGIIQTRTLDDWMSFASLHRLPICPAYGDIRELAGDPQLGYRGAFQNGTHPVAGDFSYLAEPARVEGQAYELGHPAPTLGEHTVPLLLELGISSQEIDALARAGAIKDGRP